MSNIHLVMQGKGGVGKSLLAFYIAQYVRENERHIKAVLPMPAFTNDMFHPDFLAMMESGRTFDEAIAEPTVPFMSRQRIKMMKRDVFGIMDKAGIF